MYDTLGDKLKAIESHETDRRPMSDNPILVVRIDGKAFHTLTKNLERPFSKPFCDWMDGIAVRVHERTDAKYSYVQSDEITFIYQQVNPSHPIIFDGRFHKLTSVIASMATCYAIQTLPNHLPELAGKDVMFDCRVIEVPDIETLNDFLLWRMNDARRNSCLALAQSLYTHKELLGLSCEQLKVKMLEEKGVRYDDLPVRFKEGQGFMRRNVFKPFTTEELDNLPEKHHARTNPNLVVKRNCVVPYTTLL